MGSNRGVLTIDELSSYLKIPKSTLYKFVRDRKSPSPNIGWRWRSRKTIVDRWLDEGKAEAPTAGDLPR
jgi:excisionase family DNA binding protein